MGQLGLTFQTHRKHSSDVRTRMSCREMHGKIMGNTSVTSKIAVFHFFQCFFTSILAHPDLHLMNPLDDNYIFYRLHNLF